MEAPAFPRTGLLKTRAAPGTDACIVLPLPTGTPPFTYEWRPPGATLDGRFKTSVDASGVKLTISSAQTEDTGVYILQASNDAGKDTTQILLEVSPDEAPSGEDPPIFVRRLQDLTVKVGTRTRFLVEILSSTECKVTWYRNERRLLEAERIALVRDGNFWCADVATVSVDDAGRWTCTADNLGGRASCSAHLNVLVPKAYKRPEFVEELRAILTEQGTVSLECKVVGVPTPVLRWFKDSREIKAGDVFALTANADDPTSLGTYTCEAINCMGRAYSSSKVHVIGRSKEASDKPSFGGVIPDPPPIFTKELEDQFVKICDPLTLSCHIVVPPWPRNVVWYNKEGKIDSSTKYHVLEDGVGGYMMELSFSEWADEGEWKCVATSAGGRVAISTCSVVMDVPKNYRKPRFMENLQAVLTEEGLVSFECKVVGFPTPVLSWFKDGQELKPGDVYQLTGTNSLGSYCCIAKNCMGKASSSAELTVEDIQNQLNEEEKLQLFSKNQAPKFLQGLKSVEVKIDEPFRFTIKVVIPPEPTVLWYRDDQPIDESIRCHLGTEDRGVFYLDIKNLELMDQTEWKCVAMNDYGHSVTSCFLKLIIPRHYKKPRFLENLQAILSDEGAVNLECKVIGVPQPVLKWYKDGEELKPGDIHRIISGQDGTCCLGTYTCEAQNCMGVAASSASLLGFEDSVKVKKKRAEDQILQRNLSLSTIHEERTSQMYDTPVADITLDDKGEISFSFDGKEVSVSLYETPDLTEEEALQIVEMYADQLSENVTEHNVIELPPLRFIKETSTSGNLLMEAIIIDVSPDYFASPEEDLRTEADIEDISIAEENGQAQLSFDQEVCEDYIEKTMTLLTDEKANIPSKAARRKSDSQKSGEDYFSLSKDQSLSEGKKDEDTQILSESVSFASAHSTAKLKSKPSQEDEMGTQESSDITKTVLLKEEARTSLDIENKDKINQIESKAESLNMTTDSKLDAVDLKKFNENVASINLSLSKMINNVQVLEKDINLQSQLMSTAKIASKSLEITNNFIEPLKEIQNITDAIKETIIETSQVNLTLLSKLLYCLKDFQNSLAMVEKCIDVGSGKTLIKNTCISIVNNCEGDVTNFVSKINELPKLLPSFIDKTFASEVRLVTNDILTLIEISRSTVSKKSTVTQEIKNEELLIDKQHLNNTQKAIYNLKVPLNSLLDIIQNALRESPLNSIEVNNADVILINMSSSIQDLQTALEHIEYLSVEESNSSLEKYNTITIETVISSVLKLRNSFESLSMEKEKIYNKDQLENVLQVIKVDLEEISSHIQAIENNIGQFDVLYGDNKLEILQKMAHTLITLENCIPHLNSLPNIQTTVSVFHKNLTKALEDVIECNDCTKYSTLLHICDVVSRIIVSIKSIDSSKLLTLASIRNNFNIVEDILKNNCINRNINEEILQNIYQYYVDMQDFASVYADDISIKVDSESIEDIPISYKESKANIVVQQIDQVITIMNNISPEEVAPNLCKIVPVLQNTCPILEELKYKIASIEQNTQDHSYLSDKSQSLLSQTYGSPLQELKENITVLNQVLLETVGEIKFKDDSISVFAKPLYELYTTLQTLQENFLSQYDSISPFQNSATIASSKEVLQNCILLVEEQREIEAIDEMSTLEDISCIKTSADTVSSSNLMLPEIHETVVESPTFYGLEGKPEIAYVFQLLHNDIKEIQKLDILEAFKALSDVKKYADIKSATETIEELQHKITGILSPLVMESLSSVYNLDIASNNLAIISESLLKLKNNLSVIDVNSIPIYEEVLQLPSDKINSIVKNISNLKEHLDKCLLSVHQSRSDLSKGLQNVCNACNDFKNCLKTTTQTEILQDESMLNLENSIENFLLVLETTSNVKIEDVEQISEELYRNILNVQDSIIEYISPSDVHVNENDRLLRTINKLARNIALLEQYNVDISNALEIYPDTQFSPETDYLINIENISENNIIIVQDLLDQSQKSELVLIKTFFERCKKSFSILQMLLTQVPSHKKVIRLLQEYFTLNIIINQFKDQMLKLKTNQEVQLCLDNYFKQVEDSLNKIKTSMMKLTDSLSNTLFKTPLDKMKDCIENFPNYLKFDNMIDLHALSQNFQISVNIATPHLENLEQNVKNELETGIFMESNVEIELISDSLDSFLNFLEHEMGDHRYKEKEIILIMELAKCLKNHQDYKKALGTGKKMILLKCLADCSDILRKRFAELEKDTKFVEIQQSDLLQNALIELVQPLKSLNIKIKNLQENPDVIQISSVDKLFELPLQKIMNMKKMYKKYMNISLCKTSLSIAKDIIHEINSIQENMRGLQGDSIGILENLKDIENFLRKMLASGEVTNENQLSKVETESLLQHVEQYIEVTEIIEEISAVINLGNVQEAKEIAQELHKSLAARQQVEKTVLHDLDEYCVITKDQENLAQRLQKSLRDIQEKALISNDDLTLYDNNIKENILEVITQLQDDLNTIAKQESIIEISLDDNENITTCKNNDGIIICEMFSAEPKLEKSQNLDNIADEIKMEILNDDNINNTTLSTESDSRSVVSISQFVTNDDTKSSIIDVNVSENIPHAIDVQIQPKKTNSELVIHQIERTIMTISDTLLGEIPDEIQNIHSVLENVCPILEALKLSVASLQQNVERTDSRLSDISESLVEHDFGMSVPLYDLKQNISVFNEIILESIQENTENVNTNKLKVLAKPIHELQTMYQMLQENVISQYDSLSSLQPSIATEQILHNCILLVEKQREVEIADEISTLEDISCIKTTTSVSSDILAISQESQVQTKEYFQTEENSILEHIQQSIEPESGIVQEFQVSIKEDTSSDEKINAKPTEQCSETKESVTQEIQVAMEEYTESQEKTIPEHIQPSVEQELGVAKESQVTIKEDISSDDKNNTKPTEQRLETKEAVTQESQVAMEEYTESQEKTIPEHIQPSVEQESGVAKESQVTIKEDTSSDDKNNTKPTEQRLETKEAVTQESRVAMEEYTESQEKTIPEHIQPSVEPESGVAKESQVTIKEDTSSDDKNNTKPTEQRLETKEAVTQESRVAMEEYTESQEKTIPEHIQPSVEQELGVAKESQVTIKEDISSDDKNNTKPTEQRLETKEAVTQESQVAMEEYTESQEKTIPEHIQPSVEQELGVAKESQVTIKEDTSSDDKNNTKPTEQRLETKEAVTQESRVAMEEYTESQEKTIPEHIQPSVEPESGVAKESQVTIKEDTSSDDKNNTKPTEQRLETKEAVTQESQVAMEEYTESQEKTIPEHIQPSVEPESGVAKESQVTIKEDISSDDKNNTKPTEQRLETKEAVTQELQVAMKEYTESQEKTIPEHIQPSVEQELGVAQESQVTIKEDTSSDDKNNTKSTEQRLETKEAVTRESQVAMEEYTESQEKTIPEHIQPSVEPESGVAQESQVTIKEDTSSDDKNNTKPTEQRLETKEAIIQESQVTMNEFTENQEKTIPEHIQPSVEPESGVAQESQVTIKEDTSSDDKNNTKPSEQCLETKEAVTQESQVAMEEYTESQEKTIPEHIQPSVELESGVAQESQVTIKEDTSSDDKNNTKPSEQCLETKEAVTQESQVAMEEYTESQEKTIPEHIQPSVEPESGVAQESQITIKEDISSDDKNNAKPTEQRLETKEAVTQESQVAMEEYTESQEKTIPEHIQPSVEQELGVAKESQVTIKEDTSSDDKNNTKPTEQRLETKEAVTQESRVAMEEYTESQEKTIPEHIQPSVEPESGVAKESQVTIKEDTSSDDKNNTKPTEQRLETKEAVTQESQVAMEEYTESQEKTIPEHIQPSVEPESGVAKESQVTIKEDISSDDKNNTKPTEQRLETKEAVTQESQVAMEEYTESQEKTIPEHIQPSVEQESGVAQESQVTIKEDTSSDDKNNTKPAEQRLETKEAVTQESQVAMEEYTESQEKTIPEHIQPSVEPESGVAQEIKVTIKKDTSSDNKNNEISTEQRVETKKAVADELQVTMQKYIETEEKCVSEQVELEKVVSQTTRDKIKERSASDNKISLMENIVDFSKSPEIIQCDELNHEQIIQIMERLLLDLQEDLKYATVNNFNNSDTIQNTLDEIQVQVIKLKSMHIKETNDTLKETIEDLECSIRSVLLQVSEKSPPHYVIEASASLVWLVSNLKNELSKTSLQRDKTLERHSKHLLEECVNDTETTLLLLNKVSETIIDHGDIQKIINDLNTVKDALKNIKLSFSLDEATVIEKGIEINQSLDNIEQQLFIIEGDIDKMSKMDLLTRDTIITAVHSVYTNISNMRETISNIQKSFIYQNFGKPSESLLKAIKNINAFKKIDNNNNWNLITKHFRNILNHFEEIKFYINLDKTARQPSDASLTKVVLNELRLLLCNIVLTNVKELQLPLENNVTLVINYVEECMKKIDDADPPVLEVKEKIPIFKELTAHLLKLTTVMVEHYDKNKNVLGVSLKEHTVDEVKTSEVTKAKNVIETILQPFSVPEVIASDIVSENQILSLENRHVDSATQLLKDKIRPIVEHLIEEAINRVLLIDNTTTGLPTKVDDKDNEEPSSENYADTISLAKLSYSENMPETTNGNKVDQTENFNETKILFNDSQLNLEDKKTKIVQQELSAIKNLGENVSVHKEIKESNQISSCTREVEEKIDETNIQHSSKDNTCTILDTKNNFDSNQNDGTEGQVVTSDSSSFGINEICHVETILINNQESKTEILREVRKDIQEEKLSEIRKSEEVANNNSTVQSTQIENDVRLEDFKTLQLDQGHKYSLSENNESMCTKDIQNTDDIKTYIDKTFEEKEEITEIKSNVKRKSDIGLENENDAASLLSLPKEKLDIIENNKVEMQFKISQISSEVDKAKSEETVPVSQNLNTLVENMMKQNENEEIESSQNISEAKSDQIKKPSIIEENQSKTELQQHDTLVIESNIKTEGFENKTEDKHSKSDFNNLILNTVKELQNETFDDNEKNIDDQQRKQSEPIKIQESKQLTDLQEQPPVFIEYPSPNKSEDKIIITNIDLSSLQTAKNTPDLENQTQDVISLPTTLADDIVKQDKKDKSDESEELNIIKKVFVEPDKISQNKKISSIEDEIDIKENSSELDLIVQNKELNLDQAESLCDTSQVHKENQQLNNNVVKDTTSKKEVQNVSLKFAETSEEIMCYENELHEKYIKNESVVNSGEVISTIVKDIVLEQANNESVTCIENNNSSTSAVQKTDFKLQEYVSQNTDEVQENNNKLKTIEQTQALDQDKVGLKLEESAIHKQEKKKKKSKSKLETNGMSKATISTSDNEKKITESDREEFDVIEKDIVQKKRQNIIDAEKINEVHEAQSNERTHISTKAYDILDEPILSYNNIDREINKNQNLDIHPDLDQMSRSDQTPYVVKKAPQYIDPNLADTNMGLSRPPGYIPKSFDAGSLLAPETKTYTSTSNVFYKAQNLLHDHKIKSVNTSDFSTSKDKHSSPRIKALSESRSIYAEKRAGSTRKPVFTTHLTNRTAVEGSRVKLTCSVLSSTEPVLQWYKNGTLLEDKHKYKIKFVDGLITMELLNALPDDSGDYSCTVENEDGTITTSAKLKVYPSFEASPIPPTFTRSIRDVYHRAENELVLECRIRGQPLPMITWLKDNQTISSEDRYEASYLADGLCRLTIKSPTQEDSGTYTCKAESAIWADQITHVVNFTGTDSQARHLSVVERLRQSHEARRPHFTNVLSDYKVVKGGTIGLQVEIGGTPTRVEWLREGSSVTDLDKNAQTFVDRGIYTLALPDVTEKHSGLYTCRAWSTHGNVDMNAKISVVQPSEVDGKPPVIVSRPAKDVFISVGEDINISFRVQGEPRPKVYIMKGIRDITNSQRVCKMTSDDYVKFTVKRSVISDAGTYCILARNVYGCDRAFVTVAIRQRASSESLISDWTYPDGESSFCATDRKYKAVPGRIPGEPSAVDGGNNWVTLAWPKPDPQEAPPVLAYRVDSWLLGKDGGARWVEMGITPRNTFDAFNLKQGEEYHFRVTPRNRCGWGESVQTSNPIGISVAGDTPEFIDILPGLLKVLVGETAKLSCSFKGKPTPDIVWMMNGHELEESSRIRIFHRGNEAFLTIKDVKLEDDGRYSCEATNSYGRASTYARMSVITDRQIWEADAKLKRERSAEASGVYPPQFTMRLRDRRVQVTYPVRLTCQVIGSPKPNFTWFKDGQEITFDSRRVQYQDEHFLTLEIAPTTLDDGGLYELLARNNSGAVSCRCNLVVDKGIRAYVAPEFCCGLEPLYRLNEGDELRISAIVEAYPSVGVSWYRDGVRLRPSRRAIMTLDRDGRIELALASVSSRDAGIYTCVALNEVGKVTTSGKVEIVTDAREDKRTLPTVICSDVPYSKEPMFIKKPRSTEAQEGDTVIIECEVIGDPTPEVYWLRDFLKPDYYRDAKHFKQMAAGPLYQFEIPHAKLDFTGAYSVVARNVHGEAKAIISLQIFAKDLGSSEETHNITYSRVEVIPRFEKELKDLLCYDGDAIEFECRVTGNPEPDIRWFHYNQILPECPDFESTYDLGTARLKIKQVAVEDEGTFTCEASNNLGKATSTACLVVYPPGQANTLSQRLQRPPALGSTASTPRSTPRVTPARSVSQTPARSGAEGRRLRSPTREVGPKFYTYPFNKVVEEGDRVMMQCAVGGFPTPWATWDKDGIIITPTSRVRIEENGEMMRILHIEDVNVDDVGLYRITLENDFGRVEASARIEVISHKGKFHSRSSSISPARFYRRRTPSFSRQD